MTALHYAVEVGNSNVITYLIDHGAGVNNVTIVSYYHNIVYLYCQCALNDSNINDHIE